MAPLGGGRGGGHDGKHSTHPVARLVSSSSSALVELLVFHPVRGLGSCLRGGGDGFGLGAGALIGRRG